jgi:hypothetical protein
MSVVGDRHLQALFPIADTESVHRSRMTCRATSPSLIVLFAVSVGNSVGALQIWRVPLNGGDWLA